LIGVISRWLSFVLKLQLRGCPKFAWVDYSHFDAFGGEEVI
jgi:hypothetical protein